MNTTENSYQDDPEEAQYNMIITLHNNEHMIMMDMVWIAHWIGYWWYMHEYSLPS